MKEKEIDFEKTLTAYASVDGNWQESHRDSIFNLLLSNYQKNIIRNWHIVDLVPNGDRFLIKWKKRFQPLSDIELKEKFGV